MRTLICVALTLLTTFAALSQEPTLLEYKPATLTVQTHTGDGSGQAPYKIQLSKPYGKSITSNTGVAVFYKIDPGEYTVTVTGGRYVGVQRVSVRPGSTVTCVVELGPISSEAVQAIITIKEPMSGEPIEGAVVQTSSGILTTTDAEGKAVLLNHPARQTTIAFGVGGELDTAIVDLMAGQLFTQTFYLGQSFWTLPVAYPLAFYPLNGTADDRGPQSLHGENHGATPTTDHRGLHNAALAFNGTTYVEIPHDERLNTHPMSVSFLLKVSPDNPKTVFILGKYRHPTGEGWCIFLENGLLCAGDFRRYFRDWSRVNTTTRIVDKKWHRIVLTMDKGQLTMYVDGARVPARPFNSQVSATASTEPIRLGKLNSDIWNPMPGLKGAIDDFAIFDRVLTEQEIHSLMEAK